MSTGSITWNNMSIQFDREWPSGISYSKNAEWTPVSPISRSCPILGYSSSSSGTVSINLRLSIEEGPVMARVFQIRSLVEPEGYRPPVVQINIENYISMRGVVQSIQDQVPDDVAWIGSEPSVVDVTISIIECNQT